VQSETDRLIEVIRGVLAAGPALRLAVLFGSGARGALTPSSDVDLAILPENPDLSLPDELRLQVELERSLRRSVDLVRLDRSESLLRWQVASTGSPVLARPLEEWPRFQARAASEWGDFAPSFERASARFQERLSRGTSG
jgi:predicted nucleotidyltransferase